MTFKEALEDYKELYDTALATNSLRNIEKYQRNWNKINLRLHVYYIAYKAGDTDLCTECINEILAILVLAGIDPVDELPIDIINGGGGSGVIPYSNFLSWEGTGHYYYPYPTHQTFASIDSSSTMPDDTTRENLNFHAYATKVTTSNAEIMDGGAIILRKQTVGANTAGDIRMRADSAGFYVETWTGSAWASIGLDITF